MTTGDEPPRGRHPRMLRHEPIACGTCEVGRASGAGGGQFCPFIIRPHDAGHVLFVAGDPADYVWFIKEGVVGLGRPREEEPDGQLDALCLPGSFIGLECLFGDGYLRTARAMSRASLCGATREGFFRWLGQSNQRVAAIERIAREDPLVGESAERLADGLSRAAATGRSI